MKPRPTLEERCWTALAAEGIDRRLGPDDFQRLLRSVMRLVQRERREARGKL